MFNSQELHHKDGYSVSLFIHYYINDLVGENETSFRRFYRSKGAVSTVKVLKSIAEVMKDRFFIPFRNTSSSKRVFISDVRTGKKITSLYLSITIFSDFLQMIIYYSAKPPTFLEQCPNKHKNKERDIISRSYI